MLGPCRILRRTFGHPHVRSSGRPLQNLENSGLTSIAEPMTKPNLSRRMWRCIDCLGFLCFAQRAPCPPRQGFVASLFAFARWMRIPAQKARESRYGSSCFAVQWVGVAFGRRAFGFPPVNIAVLLLGRRRVTGLVLDGLRGRYISVLFLN